MKLVCSATFIVTCFCFNLLAQTNDDSLELVAGSALSIDAKTGRILYAKNIDEKRPVASTQKLLTALLVAESGDLDERVTVERTDMQIEPRNLWITTGSRYTKRKLLEMMLVRSYNDVTKCLARDHSGSQGQFATAMQRKATELGMTQSVFRNAHGLTEPGQYSTARDMMKLTIAAYSNADIRQMVRVKDTTFKYHGGKTIDVRNSNDLIHKYSDCIGIKTGFTKAAGRCLISGAARDKKIVLSVVLGSTEEAIWRDSESLLRWSLDAIDKQVDLEKYRRESEAKWGSDIAKLEALNKTEAHPEDSILFLGSSSIRLWDDIAQDMMPYHPIKRGFGGCKFSDMAVFADRLITPHQFKAVVLFVANDIKGKPGEADKTPEEIAQLFRYMCARIKAHNSQAPVFCIAITPTASRLSVWPKQRAANMALREVCRERANTYFIDTESLYLDSKGQPRSEYFVADQLHLNELGYDLWSAAIKTHLDGVLGQ